jgi:hypothetical protein
MGISYKHRRQALATTMFAFAVILAFVAGMIVSSVMSTVTVPGGVAAPVASVTVPTLRPASRVPAGTMSYIRTRQVPVLAYHAMNDGCKATEPVCKSKDYETVSTAQFRAEMAWLYGKGYHTVTLSQYLQWIQNRNTTLPPKPILMTDDNGDSDFLLGAEQILYHYRYTVTPVIVTGFADAAATGYCQPHLKLAGRSYDMQPNCGGPNTWNMTWEGLRALSPQVYNYALEAGANGHFEQQYDKNCFAYYACKIPGETSAAYKARVTREMQAGLKEMVAELHGRANTLGWVAPYSDLGYTCTGNTCAYENHTGPPGWLINYAARHFQAVFVQDKIRNGIQHERFRFEIHASTTLRQFSTGIQTYLSEGAFRW